MRLVEMAKFLEIIPQEADRHVTILLENRLVAGEPDGRYTVSSLGLILQGFMEVLKSADKEL